MSDTPKLIEKACEVMHDAYEAAAIDAGWETQERSRVPWADVPESNKATMRAAVGALLAPLGDWEMSYTTDDDGMWIVHEEVPGAICVTLRSLGFSASVLDAVAAVHAWEADEAGGLS